MPTVPSDPEFDLFRPEARSDPYPVYRRLRDLSPVLWYPPMDGWLVTGYQAAQDALTDPGIEPVRGRTGRPPAGIAAEQAAMLADIGTFTSKWLLFMPAADHRRLRLLLNPGFRPGRIRDLRAGIQRIADQLLDQVLDTLVVEPGEPIDLMQSFAYPLPVIVIAEMLGVPADDRPLLRSWSKDMLAFFNQRPDQAVAAAGDMQRTVAELSAYLGGVLADRRRSPRDDLITALAASATDQDRLSDDELIANCGLLLFAGHETTMNLIGNGVLALLRHPDDRHRLESRPDLVPSAVSEVLRYNSPVQFAGRVATTDVQVGGQSIPAGDQIRICFGAANRDPARFVDPDRFVTTRPPDGHLAFGWGAHFCLGARLAALETEIAFATLVERLPGLELAGGDPDWRPGFSLRGLETLPVHVDPVRPLDH